MKEKRKNHIIRMIIFVILCVILSCCLSWVTMPPNVIWLNLHELKEDGPYDYLFVGTSHGQYGISPQVVDQVTGRNSFNLCMANEYPVDTYYLIKEACRQQKPKKIIYELDPSYWITDQNMGTVAGMFYKEMPWSMNKLQYLGDKIIKLDYRQTIFPWSYYKNLLPQAPQTIRKKLSAEYRQYDPAILDIPGGHYGGDGFIYQDKVEGAEKGTFNNVPWNEEQLRPEAEEYFEKILYYCKKENIELEVITLPVPAETYANTTESYQQSDRYFTELMQQYRIPYHNFIFDSALAFDRSIDNYWDYDGHMYGDAAEQFSLELGNYLKEND